MLVGKLCRLPAGRLPSAALRIALRHEVQQRLLDPALPQFPDEEIRVTPDEIQRFGPLDDQPDMQNGITLAYEMATKAYAKAEAKRAAKRTAHVTV